MLPEEVKADKVGRTLMIKGPKGNLEISLPNNIEIELRGQVITVLRKNDQKQTKALHGLIRSKIANMVTGVKDGWSKNLELVGVGFRAQTTEDKLTLTVGFSHPVEVTKEEGVSFEVKDNTKITVMGVDKEAVGRVADKIRRIKPPEPYKGKGIRYVGEYIRRKVGKAGKVTTPGK